MCESLGFCVCVTVGWGESLGLCVCVTVGWGESLGLCVCKTVGWGESLGLCVCEWCMGEVCIFVWMLCGAESLVL